MVIISIVVIETFINIAIINYATELLSVLVGKRM